MQRKWVAVAAVLLVEFVGCGRKGPPTPPEPRGPLPPRDVQARQLGQTVEIGFVLPSPRGPNPGQQPMSAELVRVHFAPGTTPSPDPDVFRRRGELLTSIDLPALPDAMRRQTLVDPLGSTIPDHGVGYTVRYGVRLRDRKHRPSPLVVASDLALLSDVPGPTGMIAEPTVDGVRLVWQAHDGAGEPVYNLYRADEGEPWPWTPLNAAPLTQPEFLDSEVVVGRRYRYGARVLLAPGKPIREGSPGAGTLVLAEDRFPPATPSGLVAVQEGSVVRLFWDPNKEPDLLGYRVYRSPDLTRWERIGPESIERPDHIDAAVRAGESWHYRVSAIDRHDPPNESPPTAAIQVQVRAEPELGGPGN